MAQPSIEPNLHAFCIGCAYPLTGLGTASCPECGRGFDLEDPTTFRRTPYRWRHPKLLSGVWLAALGAVLVHVGFWYGLGSVQVDRLGLFLPLFLGLVSPNILFAVLAWHRRRSRPALLASLVGVLVALTIVVASMVVVSNSTDALAVLLYFAACFTGYGIFGVVRLIAH